MAYGNPRLRWTYERSPIPVQDFMTTLYGYLLKRRKYGEHFREYFRLLRESQWYDEERLKEIQNDKLRVLVRHAYDTVPYYRRLFDRVGLNPSHIQTTEDLTKVPILEKETVRTSWKEFISKSYPRAKTVVCHTSGTTGKPITVFVSQNCFEREHAFRWIHYSWANVFRGAPAATIAGHPVVPIAQKGPPFWRLNRAENQMIFSSQHISRHSLPHYAEALYRFHPEMIHGYPSSIFLIARYLVESGFPAIRPRAVFTASETLLDSQREMIERAFGCKVFNWYGNTELVAHATECENGGMHVQILHSVFEMVDRDGWPVREGSEAIILGTGLENFAMPLIRYRVGDIACPASGRCHCGRGYPLVERIFGRVEDYVVTPEGRYVGRLDHVFKQALKVKEAQLIQEEPDLLKVRLVKDLGYSETDTRSIIKGLKERLGSSVRYEFDFLDEIPRERNGKFRFVINKVT
jgi:phenylacetate-CoA ligase